MPPKSAASNKVKSESSVVVLDCLVCAEPCSILGVFASCGHFFCYCCALRIHALDGKGCPVCRETSPKVFITQRTPKDEAGFEVDEELADMKNGTLCVQDKVLKSVIDGQLLAEHVRKLYEFTCPMTQCWRSGAQEPFVQEQMLREHLQYDHQLRYCRVCLKDRRVFLSEQNVYSDKEYDLQVQGRCPLDSTSFQGHPPCKFCGDRFYDGEHLLKHMQHSHFSCDVCNRGEFTFTYYKNRDKLLEHFQRAHKLCDHADCAHLDPMLRVFHSDLELQAHRQRAHGIGNRSGVSLDALGFRFSYAADAPNATSNQAATSTTPSTGSNTHALRIAFDFVSRREEVDTMPNVTSTSSNGRARGGGRGGAKTQASDELLHKKHGVPDTWRDPLLELKPICISVERVVHSPKHTKESSAAATMASWGNSPAAPRGGGSQLQGGRRDGGQGDTGDRKREMQQGFDERLQVYFANPQAHLHFRHACADFLANRLLAAEFYTMLETSFFIKRPSELEDFFPFLISTMPNPAKAEALSTVHQMRTAPEVQRQRQGKEEEDDKKSKGDGQCSSEMEKRLQRSRQNIAQLSNNASKKKPAWASQIPAATVISSPTTSSPSTAAPASTSEYPSLGSNSWGGRTTTQSTFTPPPSHSDPNDFPTLPTQSRKAHHQSAKPLVKNNAWFGKK
jgi:E3 ubiquitin-protein ligase ZNF598